METEFDKDRILNHWIESSDKDFKTMLNLFHTQNNNWTLFMGHLVIEKIKEVRLWIKAML